MSLFMLRMISFACKTRRAKFAFVWFFACMNMSVIFEFLTFRKTFAAKFALVFHLVSCCMCTLDMLIQKSKGTVQLSAMHTWNFFSVISFVVLFQVPKTVKFFTALITNVFFFKGSFFSKGFVQVSTFPIFHQFFL